MISRKLAQTLWEFPNVSCKISILCVQWKKRPRDVGKI